MPRHLFRRMTGRLQPAIDRITSHPWVLRYLPAVADPDLWHLNRRSAARAVAVGLFCGLIPGPLQALAAILCCLVVRANFPVAVVTTFYTNPLTIVPLYVLAYEYGNLFLPGGPMPRAPTATALRDARRIRAGAAALGNAARQAAGSGTGAAGAHAGSAWLDRRPRRLALPHRVVLASPCPPARDRLTPGTF